MTTQLITLRAEDVHNVYVGISTLGKEVGLGLFAAHKFLKDEIICYYTGNVLSGREASDLKDRACLMRLAKGISIDAGPFPEIAAKYINDNKNVSQINARFKKEPELYRASVIATTSIEKGDEIFVSYGKQYWVKAGIKMV